jgi:hypothetical protein
MTVETETASDARVETLRGGRNLVTPHQAEAYPGLLVVRPGPEWRVSVIVPDVGQTVVGRGGERLYAYQTIDGAEAAGFTLAQGDRATLVRAGLPNAFVVWRLERAASRVV